jgi:predicted enzyme related to lactoylglutathione lyase
MICHGKLEGRQVVIGHAPRGKESRQMKPTYFDLTVHDVRGAKRFFEQVLDWRFEKFEMPYEYYRIQAGPGSEPGIDGGIGAVKDAPLAGGKPMTQVTVPVPDLVDSLSRVVAEGGSIVEPRMPIPGVGWYATCAEPRGPEVRTHSGRSERGAMK